MTVFWVSFGSAISECRYPWSSFACVPHPHELLILCKPLASQENEERKGCGMLGVSAACCSTYRSTGLRQRRLSLIEIEHPWPVAASRTSSSELRALHFHCQSIGFWAHPQSLPLQGPGGMRFTRAGLALSSSCEARQSAPFADARERERERERRAGTKRVRGRDTQAGRRTDPSIDPHAVWHRVLGIAHFCAGV